MSLINGADRLVMSSRTLGEQVSFEERVRAASSAGFAGIGLRYENYVAARTEGLDDAAMAAMLDRYESAVMEVEYVTGWGVADDRDPLQQDTESTIFHMARTFGVRHVNAGLLEALPVETITEGFADLCRRAGDLTVALEFMPYSGIPDLRTTWDVVRGAGRPNSALLIDAWHWLRADTTEKDLAAVPADRIVAVQLSDVGHTPVSPMRDESRQHRFPPGRGAGDVVGMVRTLVAAGVDGMVTVEAMSDEIIACGPEVVAPVMMAATREVLTAASG